jgi:hypothetical protein
MRRLAPLLGLAWMAAAPAWAMAQESYTIKLKKAAKGTTTTVASTMSSQEAVKVTTNDGAVAQNMTKKSAQNDAFTETVVERSDPEKEATVLKRKYGKARVSIEGKESTLPYESKTVVIEKKGDKYVFSYDDGGAIAGGDAEWLDKEFNGIKAGELRPEHFVPTKPVKVNQAWKIPTKDLVKLLNIESWILDADKCKATGRLLKVYMKDGHQFGDMIFTIELPVKVINSPDGAIAMKGVPALVLELSGSACIDGSPVSVTFTGTGRFDGSGVFPADNPQATVDIGLTYSGQTTATESPKQ